MEPLPPPALHAGLHPDVASAPIDDVTLDRAIVARLGLYGFYQVAWPIIEPAADYSDNWHTFQVAAHLDAVAPLRLIVNGLVINVPPGTGKSALTCVAWPAHTWIHDPGHVWLYVSYSAGLSARDARRCRELVQSPWYQRRWPHVQLTGQKIGDYYTTAGGRRFSTSSEGQITGLIHADTRVVDDPIKPVDTTGTAAVTRKAIDTVNKDIWEATLSSRIKNPKEPAFAVIMQRLHEDDLAGYIMSKNPEVKHLRFPMRYEEKFPCSTGLDIPFGDRFVRGGDIRAKEGELLWPDRYGEKEVKRIEADLNVFASAQLQQRPANAAGQIIQKNWLRYWNKDNFPHENEITDWLFSWDMTFKDTVGSDYVCGQVWCRTPGKFYLIHRIYDRMNFPNTVTAVRLLARMYPHVVTKLIEDKANGPAVIAWLEGSVTGMIAVEPKGSKLGRLNAVSPYHRAGNVYYPDPSVSGYEWVNEHVADIIGFPMRRFDDTVDAESQALAYWMGESNPWLDSIGKSA